MKILSHLKSFHHRHARHLHPGIILLLGVASYANSINVSMQLDDETAVHVTTGFNASLYSLQGLLSNSRWFTDITFALNRHLHGILVPGYHLVNLAIHLAAALVIYLIVQRTIEALKRTFQVSGDDDGTNFLQRFVPFATAALFVCHPVQTQAVTYIIQRYTSLTTLLYLGSLLAYLQARSASADDSGKVRTWPWSFACCLLAILALKSKEIAFTLPLMIAAFEVALFRGELLRKRRFLALGAALLLAIPLQLFYTHGWSSDGNLFNHLQVATAETQTISRVDYLLTQFRVVTTYLRLLVMPINQNLDYDYPIYHSLLDPAVGAALLLHITLIGTAILLFIGSQRRFTAGTASTAVSMRLASLGIVWFYLALSVESSLIPIRDVIFEHRVYLPSAGFFMAVTAGAAGILCCRQRHRNALWVTTLLLCLLFTAGSIARNRKWATEMTLWQDTVEKSPNKARPRNSVGVLYFRKFMPEKALPYLMRAVELDALTNRNWIALNNDVAIIRKFKGRCSDGMQYHDSVFTINPAYADQWWAVSYNNMGLGYEFLGNQHLARENYMKAVSVDPSFDLAWYNLVLVAAHQNDTATTTEALKKLEALNPPLGQQAAMMVRR